MRILLTGANGFLGKSIVEELMHQNQLFYLSRSSNHYKVSLEKDVPHFHTSFDIVIHAAGKAHNVPISPKEVRKFYEVNVLGTLNLLKGLEAAGLPKKFVYISSVSVYGQESGINIDEDTFLGADDPYGLSKVEAENLILDWCNSNAIVCTILRLPLLVGKNPPGNLGAMIKAIQRGYYFNILHGHARKSMVLAEDIAKIILKAAEVGGIYNLTDGYHPSFNELSHLIAQQLGKTFIPNMPSWLAKTLAKLGDIIGPRFPLNSKKYKKITSDLTFKDLKAREAFGWNPTPVMEGFKLFA